jgi:hypothetical protein
MIQVSISSAQRRRLESELKEYARKSGVAVGETVAIIGVEVAKELASKVQPWGLSKAVGAKYEANILKQVQKAARFANYRGIEGDIASVHAQYRNRRGAVTVRPPKQFQPKSKIIDKQEKLEYAKTKQANAGIAKAGWIAAGENIGSSIFTTSRGKIKKISVSRWIRRHVDNSKGDARFVRKGGLNSTIYLTNKVGYAYSGGSNKSSVPGAIATGYRKSINAVKKLIRNLK